MEGLRKRPPTKYRSIIENSFDSPYIHTINRDSNEKYIVFISDGDLKVYDIDGNERVVEFPNGKDYLSAASPEEDFAVTTVADYSFIVNRKKVVETMDTGSFTPEKKGLWAINQGDYGRTYKLYINGEQAAGYTTPDGSDGSHSRQIDTTSIAESLFGDIMQSDLLSNFTPRLFGSVIQIKSRDGTDFTIGSDDGLGGLGILTVKDEVNSIADIPDEAPSNFHVKVSAEGEIGYYLKYDSGDTDNSVGVWREVAQEGLHEGLNPSTMPHRLISNGNGTFTFEQIEWDERVAGDNDSNGHPSFVGRTINDVFFYRNRLGFLADENVIMSEDGYFYNFYRVTLLTFLATELIDIGSTSNQISILKHAIAFQDMLLIFSEQEQFVLSHSDALSPETAYLATTTSYLVNTRAKPVSAGKFIYYSSSGEKSSKIAEYFVDTDTNTGDSFDSASHCPTYVKGRVMKMASVGTTDTLIVQTDDDPSVLYVYKYYWEGSEKKQSSWSRFQFTGNIKTIAPMDEYLYLLIERDGIHYLEHMSFDLDTEAVEAGFATDVLLDSRRFYSQGDEVGSEDLSHHYAMSKSGVYRKTEDFIDADGKAIVDICSGIPYLFLYQLSEIVYRIEGAYVGNLYDRLQLRRITFRYENTGYFEVVVKTRGRDDRTVQFTGRSLGLLETQLGQVSLFSGSHSVGLQSAARNTEIYLQSNSPLPCAFQIGEWEALYFPKSST